MNDLEKIQEDIIVEIARQFMSIMQKENPGLYKKILSQAAKQAGTHIVWDKGDKDAGIGNGG